MSNPQLLTQALKEVKSDKAIREIMVARTVIDHMAAMLKGEDYKVVSSDFSTSFIKGQDKNTSYSYEDNGKRIRKLLPKYVYRQGNHLYIRVCYKGKTYYLGCCHEIPEALERIRIFKETHK